MFNVFYQPVTGLFFYPSDNTWLTEIVGQPGTGQSFNFVFHEMLFSQTGKETLSPSLIRRSRTPALYSLENIYSTLGSCNKCIFNNFSCPAVFNLGRNTLFYRPCYFSLITQSPVLFNALDCTRGTDLLLLRNATATSSRAALSISTFTLLPPEN